MKKLIAALFVLGTLGAQAQEQGETKRKSIEGQTSFFAELGGPGILFSANIDRRFSASILGWGGRAGLGFVSMYEQEFVTTPNGGFGTGRDVTVVTFPIQVNYIFGKPVSPHSFEVGAGVTLAGRKLDVFNFYDEQRASVFGTASFMYRRQPLNGGFSWRAGFTPIIAKGYIQPSGGASVGYNF
ncbi:MAG TPA: hypothetical protein VM843_08350 [Flavisolibacter sp.]|jgi:hypothetical protein|nr:hypothetical protein [Flavisolibacter sp.]